MKTILTNEEIMVINQTAEFDSAIGFARAIEAAIVSKIGEAIAYRFELKAGEYGFTEAKNTFNVEYAARPIKLYAIPFIKEDE